MKCSECGLEMMIYDAVRDAEGGLQVNYVCRNPKCGHYDRRLTKRSEAESGKTEEN